MKIIEESCLERTQGKNISINSRFKVTWIIGQRKAFYRQIIPEFSCATKELVTSTNGDKKIMQSLRITSRPSLRIGKRKQFSQFRWVSIKVTSIEKT